jgi:protein-disulfide isomerase
MTSNRPSGRSSSGSTKPPTSRRSARQQRLANRETNRALARASTRGSSGSGGSLMLYSLVAVVIAVVVIGAAFYFTNQGKAPVALHAPAAPVGSNVTPTSISMDGKTLGDKNAKHTLDLYEDFQCPICRDFTADTEPQIVANYVKSGKVKIVFHDLIVIDLSTGGTESHDAANAAWCAQDQGMFWPYHDWLYANQYSEGSGAFTKDRLKTIGKDAKIPNLTTFNSCVDNGTHDPDVQSEQTGAPAPLNTQPSTPTLILDGKTVTDSSGNAANDYATVSAALDSKLGITPSPSVSASTSVSPSVSPTPAITPTPVPTPSASTK